MADHDDDDELKDGEKGGEKPWWSEAVRDLSSAGLAALFMTEDSVRNYLKEKKLPKDVVGQLLDGVSKKKEDLYGLVAKEVGRVIGKMDLTGELGKFLENHEIQFEAKIAFEPKKKHGHGHSHGHAKTKHEDKDKDKA